MRRWLAATALLSIPMALAGSASAQRILGAGRESIVLRWEPSSGPVAFYEVSCTVDGQPGVLVGTATEVTIEIARGSPSWGEVLDACVVQAFGADGNPGPPSEPSDESFEFLPDLDLDADGVVGWRDYVRVWRLLRNEREDIHALLAIGRTFGCSVDPASRVYVECPAAAAPAP